MIPSLRISEGRNSSSQAVESILDPIENRPNNLTNKKTAEIPLTLHTCAHGTWRVRTLVFIARLRVTIRPTFHPSAWGFLWLAGWSIESADRPSVRHSQRTARYSVSKRAVDIVMTCFPSSHAFDRNPPLKSGHHFNASFANLHFEFDDRCCS